MIIYPREGAIETEVRNVYRPRNCGAHYYFISCFFSLELRDISILRDLDHELAVPVSQQFMAHDAPGIGVMAGICFKYDTQKNESWPVSRVLSWTVIYLGAALPRRSSNLPGNDASSANVSLFGLAPGGV